MASFCASRMSSNSAHRSMTMMSRCRHQHHHKQEFRKCFSTLHRYDVSSMVPASRRGIRFPSSQILWIQKAHISTNSAKRLLGFQPSDKPTVKELRTAYFEAAKKTHPDMATSTASSSSSSSSTASSSSTTTTTTTTTTTNSEGSNGGDEFRQVTEAYERLLNSREVIADNVFEISRHEQEEYRQACWAVLGIPAEIVEESKRNPMFRHWLGGNTDGAQHWRAFFAVHGGLAQKLPTPKAYLGTGQDEEHAPAFQTRRKRTTKR